MKKYFKEEEFYDSLVTPGRVPVGINIYFSLMPYGEDDWLEVNCNGEWLSLGYSSQNGQNNYSRL